IAGVEDEDWRAGGWCHAVDALDAGQEPPGARYRGDESTGTDFPIGSSVSARASADPSVSPSASLCVTAVTTGASSITCQIRGASSATSGRGGASSGAGVWLPLLDFPQDLADTDAVGDSLVEPETQVRREPKVRETGPELAPNEALSVIETVDCRLAGVVFAHHAHLDGRVPEVGAQFHVGDRGHPDPRVFEVADDDLTDLLTQLCSDAFNSMSAHGFIV